MKRTFNPLSEQIMMETYVHIRNEPVAIEDSGILQQTSLVAEQIEVAYHSTLEMNAEPAEFDPSLADTMPEQMATDGHGWSIGDRPLATQPAPSIKMATATDLWVDEQVGPYEALCDQPIGPWEAEYTVKVEGVYETRTVGYEAVSDTTVGMPSAMDTAFEASQSFNADYNALDTRVKRAIREMVKAERLDRRRQVILWLSRNTTEKARASQWKFWDRLRLSRNLAAKTGLWHLAAYTKSDANLIQDLFRNHKDI